MMCKSPSKKRVVLAGCTSIAVAVANGVYAQSQSASVDTGTTISEIVVTAQKREEALQNVPISISVLTGRQLDSSTSLSVNDALNSVPGVATTTGVQGGTTQISIRGVTGSGPLFAARVRSPIILMGCHSPLSGVPSFRTRAPMTSHAWKCCAALRARCTAQARSTVWFAS